MKQPAHLLAAPMAVFLTLATCGAVYYVGMPGQWLYELTFERTAIQYVTLFVFSLAISLWIVRFAAYRRYMRLLQIAARKQPDWRERLPELASDVHCLRNVLVSHGANVASERATGLGLRYEREVQGQQDVLHFLVSALPVLGLFGTVLGLSGFLHEAFAEAASGSTAVHDFVLGLSTALDSTVLALSCSMLLAFPVWLLDRRWRQLLELRANVVGELAGLTHGEGSRDRNRSAGSLESDADSTLSVFRAELRAIAATLTSDMAARLDQHIRTASSAIEHALAQTLRESLERKAASQRDQIHTAAEALSMPLRQVAEHLASRIDRCQEASVNAVSSNLRRLELALRNATPSELVVRYKGNGQMKDEVRHAAR